MPLFFNSDIIELKYDQKGDLFSKKLRKQGSAEGGFLYYSSKEFQKRAWLKNATIYKEAAKNPIQFWEKFTQRAPLARTIDRKGNSHHEKICS